MFAQQAFRDSLLVEINAAGSDSLKAELLNTLANAYINEDVVQMEIHSRQALSLALPLGHHVLIGRSYQKLAIAQLKQGAPDAGLTLLDSAFFYFKEAGSTKGMLEALTNGANAHYARGEYLEAEKKISEILQITHLDEQFGRYRVAPMLLLGNISYQLEEYEDALRQYRSAWELSVKMNWQLQHVPPILNNMAAIYSRQLGQPDSALHLLEEAEILCRATGNFDALIDVYLNRGDLYAEAYESDDEASRLYEIAKDIATEQHISHHLPEVMVRLADISVRRGNLRTADSMLNAAADIARAQHDPRELSMILQHQMVVDSLEGDLDGAMKHFREYLSVRDSLLGVDAKLEILQLRKTIDRNEYSHQLKLLESEKEFHRARKNLVIAIFAITFLLGGVVLFNQYRVAQRTKALAAAEKSLQVSREQLLQATITNQEMEREFLEKELMHKTQRLSDIATLLSLKTELLEEITVELKQFEAWPQSGVMQDMVKKLAQRLQLDTHQKELDIYVEATSQTFFLELEDRFPGISKTEKKLCALIRLGMSNKEISALLNINPKSVEMSRYRLRKRLMLDSDTNLQEFLEDFPHASRLRS